MYAVVLKESGKVIGSIGLMTGKNSNQEISDIEGEIYEIKGVIAK